MSAAVQMAREPCRSAFDLVVIAASLGGIAAYRRVLADLPADFPAPLVLVQHRKAPGDRLAAILESHTPLRVDEARAGVQPQPGTVFVADPAWQLVLSSDGCFSAGEGGSTCRADPLLRTAAAVHGPRLAAVILTGRLDDGAQGAIAVKAAGGRVLAQDRATATAFDMPAAAIATGSVDFILPPAVLASALITLTMVPAAGELFRVSRPPWATLSGAGRLVPS
jgi:two-component system chemotaxis response regulator CheB